MLTRLDVPSVGRCRRLAKILKGVAPAAWRIRCESGWAVDAAPIAAPVGSDDYVPAYTLGQLFDWAAKKGMEPELHRVFSRVGKNWWVTVKNDDIQRPTTDGHATRVPNALADAILAAKGATDADV